MEEEDFDVPEEVETVLEELFKALRDTDTIVRYSAAKGVARVSERLPVDFTEQVLEQVLHMFSIHSIAGATLYDMPSIAEGTWHGACLACAEMARRGLVPDERLSELVEWLHKVRLVVCLPGRVNAYSNTAAHAGTILRHSEGRTLHRFKRARCGVICPLVSRTRTERGGLAAACTGAREKTSHRLAL